MTTESHQPTGDPIEHSEITGREPQSSESAREQSGLPGGSWRWVMGAVVVLLLAYPLARSMTARGAAAVTQLPTDASALELSFQHYQAGRYQEAVTSAKAALAVNPNLADAYNNLAVAYLGLRMFDEGIQAAQNAIRIRPDYQLARNNLTWIQQEKAKATGQPVPVITPTVAEDLLNQSLQHYQAGRFKECIDTATQSAKLNPLAAQAFNNIGICAANLQRWDEAIRNTEEAIRLAPDYQLAKNNLAWMRQQLEAGGSKAR